MKDMRRLNVALTRAKAGLIVIGGSLTLAGEKDEETASVWRKLIACCEKIDPEVLGLRKTHDIELQISPLPPILVQLSSPRIVLALTDTVGTSMWILDLC